MHDLRAVRGVVLAVRRVGVAARRGAAARADRTLRLLRVALHMGANTADESSRRPRHPRPAMPSSTAPGRAKARTSGSCSASTQTGELPRSRATTQTTSPSSAHSSPPARPAQANQHPSTGTHNRRACRAKEMDGTNDRHSRGPTEVPTEGPTAVPTEGPTERSADCGFPACWCRDCAASRFSRSLSVLVAPCDSPPFTGRSAAGGCRGSAGTARAVA